MLLVTNQKKLLNLLGIVVLLSTGAFSVQGKTSNLTTLQEHINYDSIKIVLESMLAEDQNIRRIIIDSLGMDSPEAPKYFQKMAEIDSRNKRQLKELLEKYGWIEKSKIGEKAAEGIFYVIQHSDLETIKKYFPQFKKLAEIGEASTKLCAMMEDRMLMWEGKKQMYGSQASSELRSDKSFAIWPIENPSEVNLRRSKAGFPNTVEEYAAALKASYDPNEKLPSKKE